MPLGDFRERYSSFINHQPENFFILSHEWLWDKAETDLTITLKNIQDEMFDCLDSRPNIRLIILDNLSSLSNIREANQMIGGTAFFLSSLNAEGVVLRYF